MMKTILQWLADSWVETRKAAEWTVDWVYGDDNIWY